MDDDDDDHVAGNCCRVEQKCGRVAVENETSMMASRTLRRMRWFTSALDQPNG